MNVLVAIGKLAGGVGLLVCALAVGARVMGHFFVAGYQVGTLFLAGIAALTAGCFFLLLALASRR